MSRTVIVAAAGNYRCIACLYRHIKSGMAMPAYYQINIRNSFSQLVIFCFFNNILFVFNSSAVRQAYYHVSIFFCFYPADHIFSRLAGISENQSAFRGIICCVFSHQTEYRSFYSALLNYNIVLHTIRIT